MLMKERRDMMQTVASLDVGTTTTWLPVQELCGRTKHSGHVSTAPDGHSM